MSEICQGSISCNATITSMINKETGDRIVGYLNEKGSSIYNNRFNENTHIGDYVQFPISEWPEIMLEPSYVFADHRVWKSDEDVESSGVRLMIEHRQTQKEDEKERRRRAIIAGKGEQYRQENADFDTIVKVVGIEKAVEIMDKIKEQK